MGMGLRKTAFLNKETTDGFNKFAYFVALPLFLFYKIGSAPGLTGDTGSFSLTLLTATLASGLVSWGIASCVGVKFSSRGAFIQAGLRGNLAFLGLPLIMFAIYDLPPDRRTELEAAALLGIAPIIIVYNLVSVPALAIFNEESESSFSWPKVGTNVVLNPILLASIFGVVFQVAGWKIPTAVFRTCQIVGASAFPLALLGIGSQLVAMATIPKTESTKSPGVSGVSITGKLRDPFLSAIVKCIFCPLVGWATGTMLGLAGRELQVILILCAVPTAISSYVLADQMKGDGDLAASTVVFSTAFSLLTLSVLLAVTG